MSPFLQQALARHQRGELAQAETLYGQALALQPADAMALHYFGLLRLQQGRPAEALGLIERAAALQPGAPDVRAHLGLALQAMGRRDEALVQFDRALAIDPRFAEALGGRGAVLGQMGRYREALDSFDRALEVHPQASGVIGNRAASLCALGRLGEAEAAYDQALTLYPNDPALTAARAGLLAELGRYGEALSGYDRALALGAPRAEVLHPRGMVLLKLGRAGEALASVDEAVALAPGVASAWSDRSGLLQALGRQDEALASLDRALAIAPNDGLSTHNRGVVLRALGRGEEALATLQRAVALQPDNAEGWNELGVCLLWDFKRPREAMTALDRCLQLQPRHALAFNNRGVALWRLDRIDEAKASFDQALAIQPDLINALNNRGGMIWARKRLFAPAVADLERVLELDPEHALARGDLFHIKAYAADWRDMEAQRALIDQGVRAGKAVAPFIYQPIATAPADLQACARIYTASHHPATPAVFTRKDRRPGKIRLGYVCGEFREQATMHLTAGLYEAHDRDRFEVLAFDNGRDDGTPMRRRVEAAFDRMIDIAGLGDPDAARRVAAEDVDILVNLNGHYGRQRMDVFARRAAPVQVNFLGFPGTLGAPYMDYIIADRTVIAEAERAFYDEQVVYLPHSYQANDDQRPTPEPAADRAAHGLPRDAFVFCHFNHSYKLTPETFARWMAILTRAEGSVLWLLEGYGPFTDNLRREAAARGVAPERLILAPVLDHQPHLARLPLADLFLDSLPYNAHTTAADALWMGLPLITCPGPTFPGRVAASLLRAAGLPELIAPDADAFAVLALDLARDRDRLAAIRRKLADARTSPLFDTRRYTRHLEAAYEAMLDRWARGEAPRGFSVAGTD